MTAQDKTTIKTYFETGDKPTQAQFENLIDSYQDANSNLLVLASATTGTVGLQILAATTTAAATSIVGGITALTGDVTASGVGSVVATIKDSVALGGVPTAATAAAGTNTTQLATTAFVTSAASTVATAAEIRTGTVANKYVAPDAMLAAIGFSNRYNSGNQTVSSAGLLTLAHGLGREPIIVQAWIKCLTAEAGYSIGDKVLYPGGISSSGTDGQGFTIEANATNVLVRFGNAANPLYFLRGDTGAAAVGTNANWALVIEALA